MEDYSHYEILNICVTMKQKFQEERISLMEGHLFQPKIKKINNSQ
jgi:hypothetical protein